MLLPDELANDTAGRLQAQGLAEPATKPALVAGSRLCAIGALPAPPSLRRLRWSSSLKDVLAMAIAWRQGLQPGLEGGRRSAFVRKCVR